MRQATTLDFKVPTDKENKMKKKNLAVTFAVVALSAIPLMAQQINYTTPSNDAKKQVQTAVQTKILDARQQEVIDLINKDINSAKKYETLLSDYKWFLKAMEDESLADVREEFVEQTVFMRIDDLAKSILNLPEHAQPYYIKLMAESKYYFSYKQKTVTLKDLFNFSKYSVNPVVIDNTSIAKLLEKQNTIKETTSNSFWTEFFQSFIRAGQTDK